MRNITDIIYAYPLQQAIEDGVLVEVFKDEWTDKPIVATSAVFDKIHPIERLRNIMEEYRNWKEQYMSKLPQEDRLFVTSKKEGIVWVMEDASVITIMFNTDY